MPFGVCLICFIRYKTKKKRKTVKHPVYGIIADCFIGACKWVLLPLDYDGNLHVFTQDRERVKFTAQFSY